MPSIINSDDGVVSGTSGLKSTGGNDGITTFQQNGTERMRIDSSGNVGIGVTPSAWNTYKAVQLPGASFSGYSDGGGNNQAQVMANAIYDGAFKYVSTDEASRYVQVDGTHIWASAASGTAGNTITFTERMRIDSSGNVGIGQTTPTNYQGVADNLVIGSSGSNGITIVSGTTGDGNIFFADGITGADGYQGFVQYKHDVNALVLGTSALERMRLNSTGALVLAGGTTTANGIGITFPATQSASTDANTLDDYEEGSFTPTVSVGITSPTYSTQSGFYTKIGNIYYWQIRLVVTGGTLNSSLLTIGGMPFTSSAASGSNGVGLFSYASSTIINSTSTNLPTIYVPPSTTLLEFYNTAGASFAGSSLNALPDFYIAGWTRT